MRSLRSNAFTVGQERDAFIASNAFIVGQERDAFIASNAFIVGQERDAFIASNATIAFQCNRRGTIYRARIEPDVSIALQWCHLPD